MNIINNINNESNLIANTNRGIAMKHKKNHSISTSCSNTQRAIKDTKFNPKNKIIKIIIYIHLKKIMKKYK